ncbi:MAG: hypothetical protein Q9228_004992 [Teloschistes exilis]
MDFFLRITIKHVHFSWHRSVRVEAQRTRQSSANFQTTNSQVARVLTEPSNRHPYHIFQLAGGTSTGGLIALMLGKMGMTVEECFGQYEDLSKVIFGKKHLRGRMMFGLVTVRYSEKCLQNCIRDLLLSRQLDADIPQSSQPQSLNEASKLSHVAIQALHNQHLLEADFHFQSHRQMLCLQTLRRHDQPKICPVARIPVPDPVKVVVVARLQRL